MEFVFYVVEAGEQASFVLREIVRLEAQRQSAEQAVNNRFRELISSNAEFDNLLVVAPSIGNPPGSVVAAEVIGTGERRLAWLIGEVKRAPTPRR